MITYIPLSTHLSSLMTAIRRYPDLLPKASAFLLP